MSNQVSTAVLSVFMISLMSIITSHAFVPSPQRSLEVSLSSKHYRHLYASGSTGSTETFDASKIETSVTQLKKVLEREYVSFFDPMIREYYANNVVFDDPMTSLSGVDSYQSNVDMLASRTLLGSILFQDAGIVLHSVEGGTVNVDDGSIDDITTRWTLRMTIKVLPWSPTARFTGISVYKVKAVDTTEGVQVVGQTDFWDSVNLAPGGSYQTVDKGLAISDFLSQLKPGGFQAQSAAPELPYQLLRRGNGYEVRRYPSYSAVSMEYERRDEGFQSLGAFTRGMSPMSPALMTVDDSVKRMMWPLTFAAPGEDAAPTPKDAMNKSEEEAAQWAKCQVTTAPSRVVAVAEFSDASLEPVVRKADASLRESLERDGIAIPKQTQDCVMFAQYDAIFSMGKRRGEVWIELEDGGHPW